MLNTRGYIAGRRNASTAYGRTSTGVEIQVTFCTAPPPIMSYVCVWYPEKADVAERMTEPRIIAAEADLVVLCVGRRDSNSICGLESVDYFVYKVGVQEESPSLDLIRFAYIHIFSNVGLLHHHGDNNPSDDPFYIFGFDPSSARPWQFTLNLYDPKTEIWSYTAVSLSPQYQHSQFSHYATKVIVMGEGDLVGFVDLEQGRRILICDVLSCTRLHHIPFPESLREKQQPDPDRRVSRDIVVVQDTIKVVDCSRCSASGRWKASVWSRKATWREENWKMDHVLEICDNLLDRTTTQHLELLPLLDVNGMPRRTLEGLHISHPALSLNDDDFVYLMAKVNPFDRNAWVLAVNMQEKKLKDVATFGAARSSGDTLSYVPSKITRYFSGSSGMKGDLKRLGALLLESPYKKHSGVVLMDCTASCPDNETGRPWAEDEDNVDLENPML